MDEVIIIFINCQLKSFVVNLFSLYFQYILGLIQQELLANDWIIGEQPATVFTLLPTCAKEPKLGALEDL